MITRAWLALVLVWLSGCAIQTSALRASAPADLPRNAELAATPFFPQTEYQCGPAALATVLTAAGLAASPSALADAVFLPARAGSLQAEMLAGARRHGAVATRIPATLVALLQEVAAGHAVVVLQNLGLSVAPVWHYAVVVGYDIDAGEVLLRSGVTPRSRMAMRTFEHTWVRAGSWGFVALLPGQWPRAVEEGAAVEAALGFERTASALDAQRVYASALKRWPENLTLAMGLGNSLYRGGDKRGAADLFKTVALRHGHAAAWINLSAVSLELGEREQALQAARQALADPAWADKARALLGEAQAAQPTRLP